MSDRITLTLLITVVSISLLVLIGMWIKTYQKHAITDQQAIIEIYENKQVIPPAIQYYYLYTQGMF